MNVGKLRQFHAAFACGFGSICWGILTTWPSYTSILYSSNSTTPLSAPMSRMEDCLLGSLPPLGAMLGTAMAGTILDTFGRKNGGVLLSLPLVVAWTIIGASSSLKVILAARFFAGISGGGTLILVPTLVSEVAEDSIRGMLISVSMFLYCFGTLLSYIMGWLLNYMTIIWINVVLSVTLTLLVMLVVESPVYQIKKRRDEDARKSIAKYRGVAVSSSIVSNEIYRLRQQILPASELKCIIDAATKAEEAESEKLNPQEKLTQGNQVTSSFNILFFTQTTRKAFIVVITVITMQVFMGMVSVQVYASTVFTETDQSNSDLYTVVFAIVQFAGALVTTFVTDNIGRRILQISASAFVGFCLAGLGYLLQFRVAPPWVTVVLIMMYCFFFMLGPGSVPYVLLAEVFIPEVKNLASMLIVEWIWLMNFFIIGVFPYITEFVGMHGAFYGFAVVSIANAIISYFIVPETAGLSNEQIQDLFLGRRKN